MPGLWKAWKAKSRLPTLSTSPLEISPKDGRDFHIPTAPAKRSGKVENQRQVSHFPVPLRDDEPGSRPSTHQEWPISSAWINLQLRDSDSSIEEISHSTAG